MEERERPRERVCARDGEESWDQGGSRIAAGSLQSGVRRRSFGVESKIFEVETERKKGRTQIFIVERKGGVSSWVKLGPASLGPLMEGLTFLHQGYEDRTLGKILAREWENLLFNARRKQGGMLPTPGCHGSGKEKI
ncbi:hypothetical protein CK203_073807 [Vitis vinifera]|uniref:Uncharacterized protein n=1 Tax=Vitis vinifera TaxID=29760 RepID=A0A438DJH9_VITVI|nr:hypothetical protein CK203_073807 [Vitis vinifera]